MINIAIFASGSGTNAQRIIEYFSGHDDVRVALVLSNKKDAVVLARAQKLKVPVHVFSRKNFYESHQVLDVLKDTRIDFIILAGFLWLVPEYLLEAFSNRIVNIHPALLPAYGGKGMYGMNVHRAVIEAGEKESGITIHLVDEKYDHGKILYQARCRIDRNETPESLAQKIHQLEYTHYPVIIDRFIHSQVQ
ncbi:MAG: phosphoribosylglycinamide formyltransferase [Bacteroidales bacterium]